MNLELSGRKSKDRQPTEERVERICELAKAMTSEERLEYARQNGWDIRPGDHGGYEVFRQLLRTSPGIAARISGAIVGEVMLFEIPEDKSMDLRDRAHHEFDRPGLEFSPAESSILERVRLSKDQLRAELKAVKDEIEDTLARVQALQPERKREIKQLEALLLKVHEGYRPPVASRMKRELKEIVGADTRSLQRKLTDLVLRRHAGQEEVSEQSIATLLKEVEEENHQQSEFNQKMRAALETIKSTLELNNKGEGPYR